MAIVTTSLVNREFLYSTKTLIRVPDLDREVLVSDHAAREPVWVRQNSREVLHSTKIQMQVSQGSREILTAARTAPDPFNVRKLDREFLIKLPATSFFQNTREILITLDKKPTIFNLVAQTFERVFQAAVWPTIANTISIERVLQSAQMALRHDPLTLPQSYNYVGQALTKVLQAYPIDITVGTVQAIQYVVKVLQSDDQGHESVSMDYVKTLARYSLYAEPLPMYRSDAFVLAEAMTVLQKDPQGFLPHSITKATQSLVKVLQADTPGFQPHSNTDVGQVDMLALIPFSEAVPAQGTNEVRNEFEVVLQAAPASAVQSNDMVKQTAGLALIYTGEALPLSVERVPSYVQKVLQRADYIPPSEMTGVYLGQNRMSVLQAASGYDNPDIIRSMARFASAREVVLYNVSMVLPRSTTTLGSAGMEWLLSVNMPSPGDMLPPSRSALVPSVAHQTLQVKPAPFEQSITRSPQTVLVALQYSFYESPGTIFDSGIFATVVAEQRASVSDFPDPSDMKSMLIVSSVMEQLAEFDDGFHDPNEGTKQGEVTQVSEQVAISSDFADPTNPLSKALVGLIGEQLAATDSFPDPSLPMSLAKVWQAVEQVAATGTFPDPADMRSPASSTQVSEQVAQPAGFFDPTKPASTVQVTLIRNTIAQPDTSLYGVPEYAIKHRPIITVNIVYSRES